MSTLVWLTPTLAALLLYGFGQGFVKKWISEVPPARFCLYFVVAKLVFNLGYFFTQAHAPSFLPGTGLIYLVGILAYIMDGAGWILYFQSIVAGPITIVGTLSAAYPALVVLFARIFLSDGAPNFDPDPAVWKVPPIKAYVVGFGSVDPVVLNQIAADTGGPATVSTATAAAKSTITTRAAAGCHGAITNPISAAALTSFSIFSLVLGFWRRKMRACSRPWPNVSSP